MRKLFRRDSELETLKAITETDADSPLQVNPGIPPLLEGISMKALARNRDERYQSAAELRAALASFILASSAKADTMAISGFVREIFAERIEKKRVLIDKAQATDDEGASEFLEDAGEAFTDTEPSIPMTTPSFLDKEIEEIGAVEEDKVPEKAPEKAPDKAPEKVPDKAPEKKRRITVFMLVLVGLTVGLGAGTVYILTQIDGSPDGDRPPADTAAVAGAKTGPDLSLDLSRDVEPDAGSVDAGLPAPPEEKSEVVKKPTRKKTAKKGRRKARRRRREPREKPEEESKKPPEPRRVVIVPPAPAPAYGTLEVACLPWCEITIDGKATGKTSPLRGYRIKAGKHKVEVLNPPSGAKASRKVVIKKGKLEQLRFRLR
jgi:hypothetical protein